MDNIDLGNLSPLPGGTVINDYLLVIRPPTLASPLATLYSFTAQALLSNYASMTALNAIAASVPIKVSQLNNDSAFITQSTLGNYVSQQSLAVTLAGLPVYVLLAATSTTVGGVKSAGALNVQADGTPILAQNGATVGQVLQWNGAVYAPATVTTGTGGV